MKIFIKILKGAKFEIEVKSEDTVADVKKTIEIVQGFDVYPAAKQKLIHQGTVLKDETTLEANKVVENSFLVIMLSKNTVSSSGSSSATAPAPAPPLASEEPEGTLDFLHNGQDFQVFRTMVRANPQILQPMLRELGKQNPNLFRLIQDNYSDFLRLIYEPVEGADLAGATPQAVTVTPEDGKAIERLEAMGFDRALVLEVYFACNKNGELTANYLLDHMN